MSDSVRPQRLQPTRLPHPWDSPGKNNGVSCHFLLQCMKVKSESEVAQSCPTLSDLMDCSPPGSSIHGIFQARVLEWDAIAFSTTILYSTNISCQFFCFSGVVLPNTLCLVFWTDFSLLRCTPVFLGLPHSYVYQNSCFLNLICCYCLFPSGRRA